MDAMTDSNSQTADGAPELEFFRGLEWAVPTAFAGALASFRFEQGDVLYRDSVAYSSLAKAPKPAGIALQIIHPPRSARTTLAEFEGNRRRTSWESEVRLQRIDLASGQIEDVSITQGKLLMTLWTGDEAWLDGNREEPDLPESGRALAGHLETSGAAFEAKLALPPRAKACRFVFVVDLASDASRVKAQSIAESLASLGETDSLDLTPASAGVPDAEIFHPALVLRAIRIRGTSEEEVEHALRGALYGGGRAAGNTADPEEAGTAPRSAAGRFSVARHGLLGATPRAAKADAVATTAKKAESKSK